LRIFGSGARGLDTGYLLGTGYSSGPRPVVGKVMPTNKLEILMPYLALAGLVGAATAAFTITKRRKD